RFGFLHLHRLRYDLSNFWLIDRFGLFGFQYDFLLSSELVDFLHFDFLSFGFLQLHRLRYDLADLCLRFLLRLGRYCSQDRSLWLIDWFGLFGFQDNFLLSSELIDFLYCDILSFGFLQLHRLRYDLANFWLRFRF